MHVRLPSSLGGGRPPLGEVAEELPRSGFCISVGASTAGEEGTNSLNSTISANAAQGQADLVAEVEALGERLSLVRQRVGEVIFGQAEVVEQALITLLSGGHALLIGVPGLAKTRLVETAGTLGARRQARQCTPT